MHMHVYVCVFNLDYMFLFLHHDTWEDTWRVSGIDPQLDCPHPSGMVSLFVELLVSQDIGTWDA